MTTLGFLVDAVAPTTTLSSLADAPWTLQNVQPLAFVDIPGLGKGFKIKETTPTGGHGIYTQAAFPNGVAHTIVAVAKSDTRPVLSFDYWDGGQDNAVNFVFAGATVGQQYTNPLQTPYAKALPNGWGLFAAKFVGNGQPQAVGAYTRPSDAFAAFAGQDGNGILIARLGVWDSAFTTAELDAYAAKIGPKLA